jgi:transcriptional regulator with XRE-family HTH domain
MRLGIRQTDLAKRIGYEQTYLSAIENGTKGPPNEELVERLIQVLELGEHEQAKLKLAVHESKKKYALTSDMPADIFKMVSELWDALDTLHPAQIQMIRTVTRFKEQLNNVPAPDRARIVRQQKQEAKM